MKKGFFYDFFRKNLWAILVQSVALLVLLFNLYLATKLAPMVADAKVLTQRVSANESRISEMVPRSELNAKFDAINNRLDTIIDVQSEIKNDIRELRK